jgi:hypothetical protein
MQAGLCAELVLKQRVIAWHTIRDNIAEVGAFLGFVEHHVIVAKKCGPLMCPCYPRRFPRSPMPRP